MQQVGGDHHAAAFASDTGDHPMDLAHAHEPRAVRVIVSDDGGSPDSAIRPPGSRLGLIGMRERVVATGGTFTAGPRPDARGFVVEAEWG